MDPSVNVKAVVEVVVQVVQEMSPRAEREIGEVADTATVPVALGKVMTLSELAGSVNLK